MGAEGSTRNGISDTDRNEACLKDKNCMLKKEWPSHTSLLDMTSMRQTEIHHERGNPTRELQARMRENDGAPPYDVALDTYLPRDHEIGMKRALFSGTLGKAPWQHGTTGDTNVIPRGTLPGQTAATALRHPVEYVSDLDFNLTRPPPGVRHLEAQIYKNASRTSLTQDDRKHAGYRRPAVHGVRIPAT